MINVRSMLDQCHQSDRLSSLPRWEVTCKSLAGHDPRRQFLEPRGLLVRAQGRSQNASTVVRHDVHLVCGVEHESIELEVFLGEISRGLVEFVHQLLRNLFSGLGRSPPDR